MMTVEIKRGESTITVMLAQIQSIEVYHKKQTAYVMLTNGTSYGCTNPGAVRDAWVQWTARQRRRATEPDRRSLFEAIFGK